MPWLKLIARIKIYRGSVVEIEKIRKWSVQFATRALFI